MNGCSICASPQVERLHALLAAKVTGAEASRILGLSKSSVVRHIRAGHAAPAFASASPSGPAPRAGDDASPVEVAREILADLRAIDTTALAPRARIDHALAVAKVTAEVAKYEAVGQRPEEVTLDEVEGLRDFAALVLEALAPYPDRRQWLVSEARQRGLDKVF